MSRLALALASTMLASACSTVGNLTSIYRTPDLDENSIVLDAEQWAILNIPQHLPQGVLRREDEPNSVVCAMPSPDAIAAAAAAGSLSVDNPGGTSGAASLGIGEAASSIGLRTQSIQLLRDAMYRMCEGYALGAVDEVQYGIMMRRFQANMIAILAIEQLTGAVAAPQAAVSASAESSVFSQLIGEREAVEREITEINRQLAIEQGKTGHVPDPSQARNSLVSRKERLENYRSVYDTALSAAARGDFASAQAAVNWLPTVYRDRDQQALAAVAQSVEAITLAAMNSDSSRRDMCFEEERREHKSPVHVDLRAKPTNQAENPETQAATPLPRRRSAFNWTCQSYIDSEYAREEHAVELVWNLADALIADGIQDGEAELIRALISQMDTNWTSGDLRDFSTSPPPPSPPAPASPG